MSEGSKKKIYRPKRWARWLIVGLQALAWAAWVGIVGYLVVLLGPLLPDLLELFDDEIERYVLLAVLFMALMTLIVTGTTVYVAAFWWTYRVELDDEEIARRGLPFPFSPRSTIRFQDIEYIRTATRYGLRIIPKQGKALALNLKMLEGGLAGLPPELLKRLPPDRVQPDLERAITEKRATDRLEPVVAIAGVVFLVVILASTAFGRQIRSAFAWPALIGWNTEVFAVAVAPDGALWAMTEGDRQPGLLGIRLHRLVGDQATELQLPTDPEFPGDYHAFEGFLNPVSSMAVDSLGHVWVVFRRGDQVARWDGQGWQGFAVSALGDPPDIREVAQLGNEIWGFSRQRQIGFSIDPHTGEIRAFNFISLNENPDSALRINPTDMQPTVSGGLVVTGISSEGLPGIIYMTPGLTIDVMTTLEAYVELPDSSWSLDFGSADADGNLYAIFSSPNGCQDDEYTVLVGVLDRESEQWNTRKLTRTLDCSEIWSLPSFAVDPHRRIWVALDSSEGGGVMVYQPAVESGGQPDSGGVIRTYTEHNSNYNGSPIRMARGGLIYAVDDNGSRAVAIDSAQADLPVPAPDWLATFWERPHFIFAAYLALMLFVTVRIARRNLSADQRTAGGRHEAPSLGMAEPETQELVFPQSRRQQRVSLLLALIAPGLLVAMLVTMPLLMGVSLDDLADIMDWPLGVFFLAMPLMLGAATGYWALFARKDRLVISEDQIERRGLRHFRIYRGPVRFADVAKVRRGARGVVVIEMQEGRRFEFAPKAFDGGTGEILQLLRQGVPSDRFEPELERRLYERSRITYRALIFYLAGALVFLFGAFHEDVLDRVRRDLAWTTEVEARRLVETIEDFALQDDGSLWLLVRTRRAGGRDPRNYEVRHLTTAGMEVLAFPALEVLYPEGLPEYGGEFPSGFTVTDEGVVRAYFFLVDTPMEWTGSRWEWEQAPTQFPGDSTLDRLQRGEHAGYWQTLASTRKILAMVPSSGAVKEIDLGDESERFSLMVQSESQAWTIARLRSPDGRLFLLPFRDDPDKSQWVEVELAGLPEREYWNIADYTVGPTGSLYTLMRQLEYCQNDLVTVTVGKLASEGGQGWIWRALSFPQDCDRANDRGQLVVDSRDRVLIEGWGLVAVYDPVVFEKPQAEPQDLTLYTEENSGFYFSHRLVVGPDGRIWSLDISGDALVWFDPDIEKLPKPLPPWIGALSRSFWSTVVLQIVGAGLFVVGVMLTSNEGRLWRKRSGR